ncbi:MAG: endonuclease/exonuclease/phosphatase family protein [Planctomycetota bacterium]
MTPSRYVPATLAIALLHAHALAQPALVDGDWSEWTIPPAAIDPVGDQTGAFDLTEVYAFVEGTRLDVAWDTGTDQSNTQSGLSRDGTVRIELDFLDGRTLTIDLRLRLAFRETGAAVAWPDIAYETMPTVASERYETTIDLGLFLGPDEPFTLDFSGSDSLDAPITLQTNALTPATTVRPTRRAPGTDVRIVSLNTLFGGLTQFDRRDQIARLLDAADPDVICFQEQSTRDTTIAGILNDLDPRGDGLPWNVIAFGDTATCSPYPLTLVDFGSEHVAVEVDTGAGDTIVVFNTHPRCCGFAGSPEDQSRIAAMQEKAGQIANIRAAQYPGIDPQAPVVVIGDWNLVGSNTPLEVLTDQAGPALADWPILNLAKPSITTWRSLSGLSFSPGRLDLVADDPSRLLRRNGYVLNTQDLDQPTLDRLGLLATDALASDHLLMVTDYGFRPQGDVTGDSAFDAEDLYALDTPILRDVLRRRELLRIR